MLRIACVALLLISLVLPASAQRKPERYALLVAIGNYVDTSGADWPERLGKRLKSSEPADQLRGLARLNLYGPPNDLRAMRDLLTGRYGFQPTNVHVLQDAQATRANVFREWEWLIQTAQPGDQVVFYYSGHGTQVNARKPGTEETGKDSALCTYDTLENEANAIIDDEIGTRLDRLKTDQAVVIIDACHSGSASRSLFSESTRYMNLSEVKSYKGEPTATPRTISIPDRGGVRGNSGKERYLGAALDRQEAHDDLFLPGSTPQEAKMGAFTFMLMETLRQDAAGMLTYRQVFEKVKGSLSAKYGGSDKPQEPTLYGPGLDSTTFLALPSANAPEPPDLESVSVAAKVVSVSGSRVTVEASAGATLTVGSVLEETGSKQWAVKRVTANRGGAPQVKLTEVRGTTALGTSVGAKTPQVGDFLVEIARGPSVDRLRVAIGADEKDNEDDAAQEKAAQNLKTKLASLSDVELVGKGAKAEVVLVPSANGSKVLPYRDGLPLPAVATSDVPDTLRRLLAGILLTELKNPSSPLRVRLEAEANGKGKQGFYTGNIGDRYTAVVTNDSSRDLYIAFLGIGSDGWITGLNKRNGEAIRLRPGEQFRLPVGLTAPAGVDLLKVVATTEPLDVPFASLVADAKSSGADPLTAARQVLARLKGAINGSESVPDGATRTDSWASAEMVVKIQP